MNRFMLLNALVAFGLVASVIAVDCDGKPPFIKSLDCCPHNELITGEVEEKCQAMKEPPIPPEGPNGHVRPAPEGPHGREHHLERNSCFMECVTNETGIYADDDINEDKLKAYIEKIFQDTPDFIPIAEEAFKSCVQKLKDFHEKHGKPTPPPGKCRPCTAFLMDCWYRRIEINCPDSGWKNDDLCNDARSYVKECAMARPLP